MNQFIYSGSGPAAQSDALGAAILGIEARLAELERRVGRLERISLEDEERLNRRVRLGIEVLFGGSPRTYTERLEAVEKALGLGPAKGVPS